MVSSPSLTPPPTLQTVAEKGEKEAELLQASAEAMMAIAKEPGTNGLGNFRFCASFCVRPGIPFFPAAYHDQVGKKMGGDSDWCVRGWRVSCGGEGGRGGDLDRVERKDEAIISHIY